MTNPRSGNDLLMSGGGTRWAKFPVVGTVVIGRIISEPEARQQTDYDDPSKRLFWDNGDPKMEVVVNVQLPHGFTPEDDEDDGVRAFHMRGNMANAVRDAVKAAQAPGLEVGGTLAVTYTGDGESKAARKAGPKLYRAQYTRPANAGNAALMGNGAAVQDPAVVAAQQGGSTYDSPNAAPQQVYTQPAPPCPPGVPGEKWAAMSPDQRATVLAALGQPAVAGAAGPGY